MNASPAMLPSTREIIGQAIRSGVLLPDMRVFDAGCGSGANSTMLAQLGFEVVGVDIDQKSIEQARMGVKPGVRAEFDHFNLADLSKSSAPVAPFGEFDAVICNETLVYVEPNVLKRELVIRALAQMTKSGGVHILTDYIGSPDTSSQTNTRPWQKGQLRRPYDVMMWDVLSYDEDTPLTVVNQSGNSTFHYSRVGLMAIKP